jgi:hypothetical protein
MVGSDGNPFCPLTVDGSFGVLSTKALQWLLNHRGITPTLVQDGSYGHLTSTNTEVEIGAPHYTDSANWLWPGRANTNATKLQHYLASIGFACAVTGTWDTNTSKAVQLGLNSTRF